MSNGRKLKWHNKALIGLGGGVCLALLHLMDKKFFLVDSPYPNFVSIGLLTTLAMVLIGVIYATVMEEQTHGKVFVNGLLAPSILLAILRGSTAPEIQNVPSGDEPAEVSVEEDQIPDLDTILNGLGPSGIGLNVNEMNERELAKLDANFWDVESAAIADRSGNSEIRGEKEASAQNGRLSLTKYFSFSRNATAQPPPQPPRPQPRPTPAQPSKKNVTILKIKKENVTYSKGERLRALIADLPVKSTHAIVLGKISNQRSAAKVAAALNQNLRLEDRKDKAVLIKPDEKDIYYISFGGLQKKKDIPRVRKSLEDYLQGLAASDEATSNVLSILEKSQVLDLGTTFEASIGRRQRVRPDPPVADPGGGGQ